MERRAFLVGTGAAAIAGVNFPRAGRAQQPSRLPRIAFVWTATQPQEWTDAFIQGLADFGYVEGKTMTTQVFPWRGAVELPGAAARAVASNPDIIVTQSDGDAGPVQALTRTIPIVFGGGVDPVGIGLAQSLSHPGGNATGGSLVAPDLAGKRVGLLQEIMPSLKRMAIAYHAAFPAITRAAEEAGVAASGAGIEPILVDFPGSAGPDLTVQFQAVLAARVQAVHVTNSAYFPANHARMADLQILHKLPLSWVGPLSGPRALFGYGPSNLALFRKAGAYVDAILKGAKPGDLPIQQPTVFDLAINLTTAKALGITYPTSILAQATMVHE